MEHISSGKRLGSASGRSIGVRPWMMQCARAIPAPLPVATPTEFIPQPRKNPFVSADSPSRNDPSTVKLSGPLSSFLTSACSRAGTRWIALSIIGSKCSQSSWRSWKAKSFPSFAGSMDFLIGSKQPTSSPPDSSRR